jgi:hypothetical protein
MALFEQKSAKGAKNIQQQKQATANKRKGTLTRCRPTLFALIRVHSRLDST